MPANFRPFSRAPDHARDSLIRFRTLFHWLQFQWQLEPETAPRCSAHRAVVHRALCPSREPKSTRRSPEYSLRGFIHSPIATGWQSGQSNRIDYSQIQLNIDEYSWTGLNTVEPRIQLENSQEFNREHRQTLVVTTSPIAVWPFSLVPFAISGENEKTVVVIYSTFKIIIFLFLTQIRACALIHCRTRAESRERERRPAPNEIAVLGVQANEDEWKRAKENEGKWKLWTCFHPQACRLATSPDSMPMFECSKDSVEVFRNKQQHRLFEQQHRPFTSLEDEKKTLDVTRFVLVELNLELQLICSEYPHWISSRTSRWISSRIPSCTSKLNIQSTGCMRVYNGLGSQFGVQFWTNSEFVRNGVQANTMIGYTDTPSFGFTRGQAQRNAIVLLAFYTIVIVKRQFSIVEHGLAAWTIQSQSTRIRF